MDPSVGAWEPPPAGNGHGISDPQQNSRLSTDAQVWKPPSPHRQLRQQQQTVDTGGQPVRGSAEFYPDSAGVAEHHGEWAVPEPVAYYQGESMPAEDAATSAEMRGGLLVVDSSSGATGDGTEMLYGGFQQTEHYSAQGERYDTQSDQSSYSMDVYRPHGFPSVHSTVEQRQHLYGDEPLYDYDYGGAAFVHAQSFEHSQTGGSEPPQEKSPSDPTESPTLMYSPGGTMYSLPSAGPSASSSTSSPRVLSSVDLQVPDLLRQHSRSEFFQSSSAVPASSPRLAPRLSLEISAELGSGEMPQQPVDYIGVVDFECTCDRIQSQRHDDGPEPEWVHEIIEFPLVLVDAVNLEPVDEFHVYIRPTERPVLTRFCKTLTGISQDTVDAAATLEVALEQFAAWLAERQLGAPGEPGAQFSIALATDGPWDIVNFLAPECERKGLPFPSCARHWIDARAAFAEWHQIKQLNVQKMLEWSGMVFEGRPHSGIDDTRNIARIVVHLLSQGCVLHPNCDVTTTHAPLPWLGAGSMRPAAVRGSTEAVVRGSGTFTIGATGSSNSSNVGDQIKTLDQETSGKFRSDALSPSATGTTVSSPRQHVNRSGSPEIDEVVEELVQQTLAASDSWIVSPRRAKRSGSAEIDEVVEELVQRTLAAADSWVVSPRRAKRASGEGSVGEHIMDLVKELVERSFGESGSGRGADGRAGSMRNSLADLDEDEPSTPSGSPTRSSPRAAELAGARSSQGDGGGNGRISSPISPQVALARSLSEQERMRRVSAEAQAQLAWSEGDAIAHELQELQHEIVTAGRSSRHPRLAVGTGLVADGRDEAA